MLVMADKNKSNAKQSSGEEPNFVAKRTAKVGTNKDGSPKISVKRGQDLGNLSKDDQEIYRKYNIID